MTAEPTIYDRVDPDRILVQSITAPAEVEYVLRREGGAGVVSDHDE